MQNGDREIWFRITIKIRKKRRSHNVHIFYRVIHIEALFYFLRAWLEFDLWKGLGNHLDSFAIDLIRLKFIFVIFIRINNQYMVDAYETCLNPRNGRHEKRYDFKYF